MESLYKSETGKLEILNLYDQKLKELNINYQFQEVETAFGKTKPMLNIITAFFY
tara:strand:+ start:388 stop:549 length:162 start_codon:yes stop_codon:yes gene_type:complete